MRAARVRFVAVVSIAAASLLALSACAPAAHPSSQHTASSPRPSATPALAKPQVRIPLTCDQVAPSATLKSVLGQTMTPSVDLPDPNLQKYAAIQAGALDCNWSNPSTSVGHAAFWSVFATPDAAGAWNANKTKLQPPYPAAYLGAGLFGACYGSENGGDARCTVDTLIGSTWLTVTGSTELGTTPNDSAAMTRFKPLLSAAITAVKGVTVTEPAWTDPAATVVHLPANGAAVVASTFASAIHLPFNVPGISSTAPDARSAFLTAVRFAEDEGAGAPGTTSYSATLEVLPSGAWAYAQMEAAASSKPSFTKVSGIGTQAFTYKGPGDTNEPNEIVLVGVSGEHLYSIAVFSAGTPGSPNLTTVSQAAAKYIVGELTP